MPAPPAYAIMKRGEEMEKHTVLICDDNDVIHSGLNSYLKLEGIDAISAYDGETALELMEKYSVDVVVLDLMLPGIDGYEVCREIRKQSDVYIIMLSARGEDIDRIIGLEIGADDYLSKPVSPREIVVRIKKALKRLRQKLQGDDLHFAIRSVYGVGYKIEERL